MIANAITIASRQIEFGRGPEKTEMDDLLSLTDFSSSEKSDFGEDLPTLLKLICQDIRKGKFDPGTAKHNSLRCILKDSAHQLVREYNPKYLADLNC